MALVIGICDDFPGQIELLLQYLESYPSNDGFEIIQSTQPQDFLMLLETKKPQLMLMDIDMGEINGIQLGERIKEILPDSVIIYITAYEKYALEAFRIRAFHYLLKPLKKENLYKVMDEALEYIRNRAVEKPEKSFSVQIKGEFINIPISEIYFFEKIGHQIKIHTSIRNVNYYGKLYEILQQLDPAIFFQCHQGYIVNIEKIRSFRDKKLILEKNIVLPVSRSYNEAVRNALAKKLFTGKEEK